MVRSDLSPVCALCRPLLVGALPAEPGGSELGVLLPAGRLQNRLGRRQWDSECPLTSFVPLAWFPFHPLIPPLFCSFSNRQQWQSWNKPNSHASAAAPRSPQWKVWSSNREGVGVCVGGGVQQVSLQSCRASESRSVATAPSMQDVDQCCDWCFTAF